MELAKKSRGGNYKSYTRFLKIFPQYFAINVQSFYDDPEIEITTARRKIMAQKYCRKANPNSRTLQNVFRNLQKNGLLLEKGKNKTYHKIHCTRNISY